MSIEFIKDDFLEGKKEELENIDRILSEKPKKIDRRTIFLKRFTLALMGQYKFQNRYMIKKHEEMQMMNKQILQRPIQRIMPQAQLSIPTPYGLQVPMPSVQRVPINISQLRIPEPLKEELKIPNPININVPRPENIQKKEVTTPKPI